MSTLYAIRRLQLTLVFVVRQDDADAFGEHQPHAQYMHNNM